MSALHEDAAMVAASMPGRDHNAGMLISPSWGCRKTALLVRCYRFGGVAGHDLISVS